MLQVAILLLLAYLVGSFTTAIVVSRALGLPDPRTVGSGNPGATNMLRVGSKKAAILTLAGDVLKGWLPVVLVHLAIGSPVITVLTGIAVLLGHIFPVFFHFKGGRGVATAFGILLGCAWKVGLLVLLIWAIVLAATRYVSLASVVAAMVAPLVASFLSPEGYWVGIACIGLLIAWRHTDNLKRLWAGTESKIQNPFPKKVPEKSPQE